MVNASDKFVNSSNLAATRSTVMGATLVVLPASISIGSAVEPLIKNAFSLATVSAMYAKPLSGSDCAPTVNSVRLAVAARALALSAS